MSADHRTGQGYPMQHTGALVYSTHNCDVIILIVNWPTRMSDAAAAVQQTTCLLGTRTVGEESRSFHEEAE